MTNEVDESIEDDAIDALFEGEEETEEAEEAEKTVETAETEETPETTEEAETPEAQETEKTEEPKKEPTLVPIAALHDVRRKSQQLKEENEALRSQIPTNSDEPDMYDDPDGWKDYQRNKVEEEISQRQQAEYVDKIENSRVAMLESTTDYAKKEEEFLYLTHSNPELALEMANSSNPAKFAYDKGTESIEQRKAVIRAELLGEEAPAEKSKTSVPSLASATATGSSSVIIETDEDIDDMFADQKY